MSDISDNVVLPPPVIDDSIIQPLEDPFNSFINKGESYTAPITRGTHTHYFAVLYISTPNEELRNKYIEAADEHNRVLVYNVFPDSGFDLYTPTDVSFNTHYDTTLIDMQINTKMLYYTAPVPFNSGFYMHPRSSIAKTPLMLANHTGIIDSGYRGTLISAFRWLPINNEPSYTVTKNTRLVQLCHPTLCPVYVRVVPDINDYDFTSLRGSKGFGSTGI